MLHNLHFNYVINHLIDPVDATTLSHLMGEPNAMVMRYRERKRHAVPEKNAPAKTFTTRLTANTGRARAFAPADLRVSCLRTASPPAEYAQVIFDIHVHTTYFKQEDKLLSILTDQNGAWSKSTPCKDGKRNLVCNNPAPLGDGAYCNGLAIEDC